MSTIEILGAVTGLLCVWLTAKERLSSFPVGIVNIFVFAFMFYEAKLYADFALQLFFFLPLTVYGWYAWLYGDKNSKSVAVTRNIGAYEAGLLAVFGAMFSVVWAGVLHFYTDAAIPWLDAPLAVASIIAQLLLSRKILQNWLVWIAVDVLSIGMYAYKELYITSCLYAIFLFIAIKGYLDWRKEPQYAAAAK